MPDFGFWELVLILLVALLVVGPKQLPTMAATLGHHLGRLQQYVHHLKAEIDEHTPRREVEYEFKRISQSIKNPLSPEPQDNHLREKTHLTKPSSATTIASHSSSPSKKTSHGNNMEPKE